MLQNRRERGVRGAPQTDVIRLNIQTHLLLLTDELAPSLESEAAQVGEDGGQAGEEGLESGAAAS